MSKKYFVIKGSKWLTGETLSAFRQITPFLENDAQIIYFDTFQEDFLPCDGCNVCKKTGKCKHRDLDLFYRQFEECDEIFILSPVFNGTFPAPLKGLIDRFQVYFNSFYENGKIQPVKKHRKAYFIASCGRNDVEAFEYMKKQLRQAFTILNIELTDSFLIKNADTQSSIEEAIEDIKRSLQNG